MRPSRTKFVARAMGYGTVIRASVLAKVATYPTAVGSRSAGGARDVDSLLIVARMRNAGIVMMTFE